MRDRICILKECCGLQGVTQNEHGQQSGQLLLPNNIPAGWYLPRAASGT